MRTVSLSSGNSRNNISSITYNHLNLPVTITTYKGTVTYTYDAAGNKLKKVVADSGFASQTTLYLAGVCQNDTLQFLGTEEGRLRFKDSVFHYDYFLKDHLGNVRMVLTEEVQEDQYPAASMETAANETNLLKSVNPNINGL